MDNGNRLIGIDGKKPMILVVDDTPSNLVVISTIVEDEGGEVRVARNGPTALRLAQLSLNSITGEFSSDDLLGVIFSSFCIGK